MNSVPAANYAKAKEIDRIAKQWHYAWTEVLRVQEEWWSWANRVTSEWGYKVEESRNSVSYDDRAVLSVAEKQDILENDIQLGHLHPDDCIYRSNADIKNWTEQYIKSGGEKDCFPITVVIPETWVRVEVMYDHDWNVIKQELNWKYYDMVSFDTQGWVRPLLENAETSDLISVRVAINKAETAYALVNNLLSPWEVTNNNEILVSDEEIEWIEQQVWTISNYIYLCFSTFIIY